MKKRHIIRIKMPGRLKAILQKAAIRGGKWFDRLPAAGKKWVLFTFCFIFGGTSLLILARPIWGTSPAPLPVHPIHLAAHATESGELPSGHGVSPAAAAQITAFRHYLDSLRADPHGIMVYDSLSKARPGLLDSLALVEKIIHQQTK